MPDLPTLIVAGLATWRVSHLLLYENGPFELLRRGRELLGVEHYGQGVATSYRWEITVCMFCLSVWVGGAVGLLLWLWPPSVWLMLPYALSAIACLIGKLNH